jgi:hypothetical protein
MSDREAFDAWIVKELRGEAFTPSPWTTWRAAIAKGREEGLREALEKVRKLNEPYFMSGADGYECAAAIERLLEGKK